MVGWIGTMRLHFYSSTHHCFNVTDTVAVWMMTRGIPWQSYPNRLFDCMTPRASLDSPLTTILAFSTPVGYFDIFHGSNSLNCTGVF